MCVSGIRVEGLYFAASHGFEIIGPQGSELNYTVAHELLPTLQDALKVLRGVGVWQLFNTSHLPAGL